MTKALTNGYLTRCYVVGGGYDYIKYMYQLGFQGAKDPDEADILLFTGGEDVSPEFYDENKLECTFTNIDRDRKEKIFYEDAIEKGLPMIGICRGGQFLNVMNGGKMWQDVNNHTGDHLVEEVQPKGTKASPLRFTATSTHHQMMRPSKDGTVLAVGVDDKGMPLCDERIAFGQQVEGCSKKHPDVEVVWYEKTKCLCFQPHPEYNAATKECREYFEGLLDEYILPAT